MTYQYPPGAPGYPPQAPGYPAPQPGYPPQAPPPGYGPPPGYPPQAPPPGYGYPQPGYQQPGPQPGPQPGAYPPGHGQPMPQGPAPDMSPADVDRLDGGLAGAKEGVGRGRDTPNGKHVVDFLSCTYKKTYWGPRFIFEFVLIESTAADAEIGGRYSWAVNTEDQFGYGKDEVKGILGPLARHRNYQGPLASWAVSPANPIAGTRWVMESEEETFKSGHSKVLYRHWECMGDSAAGATKGLRPMGPAPALGPAPVAHQAAPVAPPPGYGPPPGYPPPPQAAPPTQGWTPPPGAPTPAPSGYPTLPWQPPAQAAPAHDPAWGPRPANLPAHLPWPPPHQGGQ